MDWMASSFYPSPTPPKSHKWPFENTKVVVLPYVSSNSLFFHCNSAETALLATEGGIPRKTILVTSRRSTLKKPSFQRIKALFCLLETGKWEISGSSQRSFWNLVRQHVIVSSILCSFCIGEVSLFSFLSENTSCRKCCVSFVLDSLIPSFAFDYLISFSPRLYIVWMIYQLFFFLKKWERKMLVPLCHF